MTYVKGKLLVSGPDYNTSVSAVNLEVNGQNFYVAYIDSTSNLKASYISIIPNIDGTLPILMSGCSIV